MLAAVEFFLRRTPRHKLGRPVDRRADAGYRAGVEVEQKRR
ncbi:hypothetical protein PC116_g29149 [Phytophthora cactorum]|nr:hypothetical protein PC116_g29149 [Phytophthora cactorum]